MMPTDRCQRIEVALDLSVGIAACLLLVATCACSPLLGNLYRLVMA